jgi:ABC-type phosphate transport system permease subunit
MSHAQQPQGMPGPYGYQQAAPPGYYQQVPGGTQPRKKRRIFLWVFLAIQTIFLIWLITGLASKGSGPSVASQTASACSNGGWQGLFKSHADCMKHYAVGLQDAGNVGKGLGAAIIIVFWMVVDVILGIGYGVYKLARR